MVAQRRRAQLAADDEEERLGRALEQPAVRRGQQRLVEAALGGQARREHVRPVGQRLDAVEDPRRRERDLREPDRVALRRQRLEQQDPPAAAGDQQPDLRVAGVTGRAEQRREVGAQRVEVDRQAQVRRRAAHALEVVVQRERRAAVQAHDLEDAVAAQQPLVGDRDPRVGGVADHAVQAS